MFMPTAARTLFARKPHPQQLEQRQLQEELERTRVLLNQAYAGFNLVKDGDLIDSYVFEIKALQARYNYLLRQVKALEAAG